MTHFAVHGHSIHAHWTLYTQATSECARSTRRERRLFLFSRLFCSRLFSISLPQLVRIDKLEELAPDLIVLERLPMAEHQKPAYTGGGGGGQPAIFGVSRRYLLHAHKRRNRHTWRVTNGGTHNKWGVTKWEYMAQTKPTHIACGKWWDTTIGV